MPEITDKPPADTRKELEALSAQLDRDVPKRSKDNLLVATWNIREFGGLTDKWHSDQKDSPKRDLHALACITEIVSRFDVVAIQEVQTDIRALRHMLKALGDDFTVILTDAVEDDKGGHERLAFVFNRKRLEVSGLACELVVPLNWTKKKKPKAGIDQIALQRQFARTPYAVAFKKGNCTFILVTLHVIWGTGPQAIPERTEELSSIATWLRSWAEDTNNWDQNLICLGDFNIDRQGGDLWKAFTSTGLTTPDPIAKPRIIGGKPLEGFYDQISWFVDETDGKKPLLSLTFTGNANMFDWSETALAKSGMTRSQKSYRMSDHFPLWVEFSTKS
ncbi:MAG TPA: endonuclease/exonuclease/phosphatase family protein [Solirubrobacterales bacterium]|nr:endonuclease/exonuclease/phosphatase family protein [Solirubrobacterales bacterium]